MNFIDIYPTLLAILIYSKYTVSKWKQLFPYQIRGIVLYLYSMVSTFTYIINGIEDTKTRKQDPVPFILDENSELINMKHVSPNTMHVTGKNRLNSVFLKKAEESFLF
jgi:hypothetical protein